MANKPKAGTAQINVELDAELLDRLKQFAEERGQTLRYTIGRAIVRHLDYPPALPVEPPLPDCEPDPTPEPKKATAKRGKAK